MSLQNYAENQIVEFDFPYNLICGNEKNYIYELKNNNNIFYVIYYCKNNEYKGTVMSKEKYDNLLFIYEKI